MYTPVMLYCAAAFIPLVIGLALAGVVRGKQHPESSRRDDYRAEAFWDAVLEDNESAHGFVFFPIPERARPSGEAALLFHFIAEADGTEFVERLPVSGLKFEELPESAEPMPSTSRQMTP